MRILIVWLINTVALLVLPYLMTSIRISGFWTALIAALVLGLVNALIRADSRCVDIACNAGDTGSFHFVINGLLFWLVSRMVDGFYVSGFWAAE